MVERSPAGCWLPFAPEKGEVTRGKIRRGSADVYGKGRGWVAGTSKELREKADDLTEQAKAKVQDVTGSAAPSGGSGQGGDLRGGMLSGGARKELRAFSHEP